MDTSSTGIRKRLRLEALSFYGDHSKRKLIGDGTFGYVFSFSGSRGEKYAYKNFIKSTDQDDIDPLSYTALREIAVLRTLSHPNIIGLLDVCMSRSTAIPDISLLMEAATCSLYDYQMARKHALVRSNPNFAEKWQIVNLSFARQMVNAVYFLHQHNIWHRDLKPGNILVFPEQIVRVCDFGSVKTNAIPGGEATPDVQTIYWRAPEAVVMGKIYDGKIDVFSLGLIIAELYLERIVFPADQPSDLIMKHMVTLGGIDRQNWPTAAEFINGLMGFEPNSLESSWDFTFKLASFPIPEGMQELIVRMTMANPEHRAFMGDVVQSPILQLTPADLDVGSRTTFLSAKPLPNNDVSTAMGPDIFFILLEISARLSLVSNYAIYRELIRRYFIYLDLESGDEHSGSRKRLNRDDLAPEDKGLFLGAVILIASDLLDTCIIYPRTVANVLLDLGLVFISNSNDYDLAELEMQAVDKRLVEAKLDILKILEFDILPECTLRQLYKTWIPNRSFFGTVTVAELQERACQPSSWSFSSSVNKIIEQLWDSKGFSIYCSLATGLLEALYGEELSTNVILRTVIYAGLVFVGVHPPQTFSDVDLQESAMLLVKFRAALSKDRCFAGTSVNVLLGKVPVMAVFNGRETTEVQTF
jgi:serine/threonine protein kinase